MPRKRQPGRPNSQVALRLAEAERRKVAATRDLAEAREGYRALFELAPDAYLVTDPSGRIVEANRAAQEMLSVSGRLLSGRSITSLVVQDLREAFSRRLEKLSGTEGVLETESCFETPRRTLDVSMSIAPIRKRGALTGFRWIVRDITARKQTERELRTLTFELERRVAERTHELEEERARLHAIVEHMPAGLLITDAEGEATFMNSQAQELLAGLRMTDDPRFPRRFPAIRLDGEPYPEGDRPSTRALLRGETTTAERLYFERDDGTRVLFEVSAAPIRDSIGRIIAAALTIQDVSGLERQEQSEREFVANAAHELRTPIAAVLSAVEVLQAGAKENTEDRDLFLGHIEREANRLARLAHTLLVLARAQAGHAGIKVELVELRPLLQDVADTIETQDAVEVAVECASDLRIWSDRDLLEQALTSLANNAVAYTSAGRVTLAASQADSTIALEVRDTGSGIEPEDRERVFERFYRSNRATHEGFGLGLAIVQQAAEALAAEIELDSDRGTGTTIRLRLSGKLRA
ncbi:MAG TPA: PAS domain S-box protein [Gaiellaceae bacterium]|jgi:PAS domain S-box-containing protein|nr:PAS domain S-box protein [Gaiellaceae bacterium]